MSWLDAGAPIPELEGWKRVGDPRLEWGNPNTSADFDLLFIETLLSDADIESRFYPHRPNEGFFFGRPMADAVCLYVPTDRWEEAETLIAEVLAAPIDWGDLGEPPA